MLFNSIDFAVFLPIVFILYWFVTKHDLRLQNALLLAASYVFYGWWDWRFLSLIVFSSSVDYIVGIKLSIESKQKIRRLLLIASVFLNIGLLATFKYFNFFSQSFVEAFRFFGYEFQRSRLNIVLPVGISFYTFQTLSYSIDVYRKKIKPTRDIVAFFAFVAFFPQLVAGPIERAAHLLPQFTTRREFDHSKATDGIRQILWGLFKKIVIADNCARYVNQIFSNSKSFNGSTLVVGLFLFAFQIYGDFSGYSDIAIGTARLFGFDIIRNFAYPYFSRNIAEFWRRWHISLSSWFRDYIYIPLGGSKRNLGRSVVNVFIVFVLSGFWHGADWKFIVWGMLHALYFMPLMLMKRNRKYLDIPAEGRVLPRLKEFFQISSTFILTTFAWVFFRASNVKSALYYIKNMFGMSLLQPPEVLPWDVIGFIVLMIGMEWLQRTKQHPLQIDGGRFPLILRWGTYYSFFLLVIAYSGAQTEFIYFQF